MWDLNYNDLYSLYGISSTYSSYNLAADFNFWRQRRLLDLLDGTTDVPKRNRTESRKHIREMRRRHAIRIRIDSLLEGVPMEKWDSFTTEELIELRKIKHNGASYDYWPISKSVTRRLRGLVKKQNGRRITVSLEDFLVTVPHTLNETEV